MVVGRLHWQIINPRGERIAAALFILNGLCVFFCELFYNLDNFLVIFRCAHDDEGIAVILQTNNATDLGFSQHLLELLSRNPRDGNHRRTRCGTNEARGSRRFRDRNTNQLRDSDYFCSSRTPRRDVGS